VSQNRDIKSIDSFAAQSLTGLFQFDDVDHACENYSPLRSVTIRDDEGVQAD
jgi:hypothetical protein